jgi:sterol desaturase/sphingolipid hydroxylase (fatty acid hydroxylase superfamily)
MKLEYVRHQRARMFQNDVMESFTEVHPVTPFLVYIPLVVGLTIDAFHRGIVEPFTATLSLLAGWVIWQWLEYIIHRFFFHWEGIGPISRRVHDVVHGYHHKYPDDFNRLVMPLSASIPLALLIAGICALIGHPDVTLPLYVGIVSGYLWYDFNHWSTHARKPLTAWGKAIRSHHMAHHFADPNKNFGISHRWIDRLFGTLKVSAREEEASSAPRGGERVAR